MLLRNKVLLVKGASNTGALGSLYFDVEGSTESRFIAEITSAVYERLSADNVMMATGLLYPEAIPPKFSSVPLQHNLLTFANLLNIEEQGHLFLGEYSRIINDRRQDIRVVFGDCLRCSWVYDALKTLHKSMGHRIVEVDFLGEEVLVGDVTHSYSDAVELLQVSQL